MTKAVERMSADQLVSEMQALDAKITALREQKRTIGQRYDQLLTEERARTVFDALSDGERDALARISTQVAGAAPQKSEG